jgi:hypothetical protein
LTVERKVLLLKLAKQVQLVAPVVGQAVGAPVELLVLLEAVVHDLGRFAQPVDQQSGEAVVVLGSILQSSNPPENFSSSNFGHISAPKQQI